MKFRYFRIAEGPLVDEVRRILAERKEIADLYAQFEERIGAKETRVYHHSGKVAGFTFNEPPSIDVWRKPTKDGLYLPRKNSPTGKALHKEIDAFPRFPALNDALALLGLPSFAPLTFEDGKCYFANLYGFPSKGVLFVRVPWRDVDPEQLADYREKKGSGTWYDSELEAAMWEPSPEMVEVKEWQVLKEMDKDAEEVSP